MEGAALIAVTTVNNDHDAVAAALAPLLRDGQIVCLIPAISAARSSFAASSTASAVRPG